MDNVTHTLFALTLARTPLRRAGRGTAVALVLASNAPDIDIVAAARGAASYLQWHRGPTHGVLGVVGLGLVVAVVVWLAGRFREPDPDDRDASLPMLLGIASLGVFCHILMDLPTSYGTRLLSPFDWRWFAFDWLPIIDIYLMIVLAAGLAFGRGSAAGRRYAVIALAVMAFNYVLHGVAHGRAIAVAPRLFGPTLPERCDPNAPRSSLIEVWPRPLATDPPDGRRRPCLVELAAIPTFSSPFRWRVIAHLSNAYEVLDVDILNPRLRAGPMPPETPPPATPRFSNVWTDAVERAAATRTAQIFLGFTRFPAARAVVDPAGVTTVQLTDVRFVSPTAADQRPGSGMFSLTVRLLPDGGIEDAFGQ